MPATRPSGGYPLSFRELKKFSQRGPMYRYLESLAKGSRVELFDDMLPSTMIATNWAVANSSGTSAASFAALADTADGVLQGDTGTDDNGSISLIGQHVAWYGDQNCGMEIRLKTDVVTDFNIETGFATAAPGSNAAVFTDVDTPTIVTDSAIFAVDTDQTIVTAAFGTDGSTSNQDVKRTSLAGIPGFTAGNLPVAATFYTVRIQLIGNSAYCFVNGKLVASHDDDPQGNIEGGTKVAPWVYCRTRSTTAVFPEIDYIWVWQDRLGS
jgi:hypothetical protein